MTISEQKIASNQMGKIEMKTENYWRLMLVE
jgi:hypothetical protein